MPAIEVDDLTVRYGALTAVAGLSMSADAGEVLGLLGPNGAGKTSTVETLEGYRQPTSGRVRVLGLDPDHDHRALTARIGVMLQQGGVYPGITPREALRLFAAYYRGAQRPDELLERVGLVAQAATPVRRLSGGEAQRLSLALALVGRPEVAFLDEPTSGIDVSGRQLIREIIRELRDDGVCVLVTTHDLDEAEKLADRVVIIDHGQVVGVGTPAELMTAAGGDEIRFGAPPALDVADLGARLGAAVTEESPGEYRVAAAASPQTVAALTAWLAESDLPLADLRAGRQRLEDVFLRLTATDATTDGGAATDPPASRRRASRGRLSRRRRAPSESGAPTSAGGGGSGTAGSPDDGLTPGVGTDGPRGPGEQPGKADPSAPGEAGDR